MRLLIVGTLNGQLSIATKLAMDKGALVTHAADIAQALAVLRSGRGADLLMVDVAINIRDLVAGLELEHIHVPIVACGIATDARAAVAAIQAGAKEYIPLPPDAELIAAVLAAVADDRRELIYRDEAMARVVKLAEQVAASDASVLITGESGTGKEVLARLRARQVKPRQEAVHLASTAPRSRKTCWKSELFGHEKGAFTGAVAPAHRQVRGSQRRHPAAGRNLAKWTSRLQAKLLRAIQEREIDRVGGAKPVKVDIRIIATSNRDLAEAVRDGGLPRGPALSASMWSICACRRCASGRATFGALPTISPRNTPPPTACPFAAAVAPQAERLLLLAPLAAATCANWKTPCTAPCCWRAAPEIDPKPSACRTARRHAISRRPRRRVAPRWRGRGSRARPGRPHRRRGRARSHPGHAQVIVSATAPMPPMCWAFRSARCATSSTNMPPTACRCRRRAAAPAASRAPRLNNASLSSANGAM